jgi:hypothetical protein
MQPLPWWLLFTGALLSGQVAAATELREEPAVGELGAIPPALLERALETSHLDLPDRMQAISQLLLETPYLDDPLGEGFGEDPDPFARYDAFDCLTFLEEVLALSISGAPSHAAAVRNGLRYGDKPPSYATRRHFMTLQWIPGNTADGWLRDTTAEYGPSTVFQKEVTPGVWKAWNRRGNYALTDEELPMGTMRLNVLPLDEAIEAAPTIRPGSIIFTVREDRSWIPLWITHVGFVVAGEETTIRHASRMKSSMRVRDHGLVWYLEHLKTYANWRVAGISILEPIPMGPRNLERP